MIDKTSIRWTSSSSVIRSCSFGQARGGVFEGYFWSYYAARIWYLNPLLKRTGGLFYAILMTTIQYNILRNGSVMLICCTILACF